MQPTKYSFTVRKNTSRNAPSKVSGRENGWSEGCLVIVGLKKGEEIVFKYITTGDSRAG